MKHLLIILSFLAVNLHAQTDSSGVLPRADQMPEFPGGQMALFQFIKTNTVYPETAVKNKLSGKCFVKFVVTADGSIRDAKIVKGTKDCPECDAEALRVISMMPKWIPGKQNGIAVAVYYMVPFNFQN